MSHYIRVQLVLAGTHGVLETHRVVPLSLRHLRNVLPRKLHVLRVIAPRPHRYQIIISKSLINAKVLL